MSDVAAALQSAAQRHLDSARTHKRSATAHRREAKAEMRALAELQKECDALGIELILEPGGTANGTAPSRPLDARP